MAILIIQLLVILAVCRLFGFLFKKFHQPAVVGEIIAGIALGPSLFGLLLPRWQAHLFPPGSTANLQVLSQAGLIFFMFVVGMELDMGAVRKNAVASLSISFAGILFPFVSGMALSRFLYNKYVQPSVSFHAFAMFMGIAMSITAFPVLARIIKERGMTQTKTGIVVLTAAATGDVAAWCILAAIVAMVKAGTGLPVAYLLLAVMAYILFMFVVVKPLLKKVVVLRNDDTISPLSISLIAVVLILSAHTCEALGIHALIGAFAAGLVMPQNEGIKKILEGRIKGAAKVLLPLFFVITGLRTQLGLMGDATAWLVCLLIISVAVAGKFGGSAIAARLSGESAYDSVQIGILMNTRGLVELVVLNIGYDLGILPAQVFTMLVIMALATTFMTSPLLDLAARIRSKKMKAA